MNDNVEHTQVNDGMCGWKGKICLTYKERISSSRAVKRIEDKIRKRVKTVRIKKKRNQSFLREIPA